ncbi:MULTISPECIES: MBL fold metallo-hydrolase [unclassified Clostridium]|uniref:MBL fold metallo-hydrolase n=1 Tax=unclassified Clostridium TaxID=2614128 RepID=UPI0002973785|nr:MULTISPECIES: MBL fold metallo-hydrolase [unclassified Clostridium]EKQ57636.1 MAG: Zn-dependent hydrolase, glyoxylase [Clostridium sp. Maddingley MBC34-26]
MRIENGIYMLEVPANIMEMEMVINLTLILDEDSLVLIDTGFPGQLHQIREVCEKEGIPFSKLNTVILTHQDIDHIGGISDILKEMPGRVKVLAHEEEKAYINGEKKPVKLSRLEDELDHLPANMKIIYEKLKAGFEKSRVNVNKTLIDLEELPYCGGITVVHTPGHTPGHISLYLEKWKILIAGDILCVKEGLLVKADQNINFDNELNKESLKKLMNYDIETVICYHGGVYKGKVNERIAELAMDI